MGMRQVRRRPAGVNWLIDRANGRFLAAGAETIIIMRWLCSLFDAMQKT